MMNEKILDNLFYSAILFFPLFYVLGNAVINFSIILSIVLSTILIFKKKKFFLYREKFFILGIIFCILVVISSIINNENSQIDKSLLYLRYPFFSLSIIFFYLHFSQKKIIFFYKFNFILIVILIFDYIFQIFNKKNFFGFEARCFEVPKLIQEHNLHHMKVTCDRYGGMFNDELIMGMYLLIFGILILNIFLYFKNKVNFIFLINIFIGILILKSGEKTNFLSFAIFIFFLSFYFIRKFSFRKILISVVVLIISTTILFKYDKSIQIRYVNFYIENLKPQPGKNIGYQIYSSPWFLHYRAATEIYKDNLIFGSGIKSFRKVCKNYEYVMTDRELRERDYRVCSTHPHNMYIEVLSETGTISFIILNFLIIYSLYIALVRKKNFVNYLIFCLLLSFLFPFKPTGSFYSTITASLFWYLISLPIAFKSLKENFFKNE